MEDAPILLTIPQAAAMLAIGDTLAYELAASGSLPVVRLGRAVRVPRAALLRWIDAQTTTEPSSGAEAPAAVARAPQKAATRRTRAQGRTRRQPEPRAHAGISIPAGAELLAG